jgi:hypothetical protein
MVARVQLEHKLPIFVLIAENKMSCCMNHSSILHLRYGHIILRHDFGTGFVCVCTCMLVAGARACLCFCALMMVCARMCVCMCVHMHAHVHVSVCVVA